MTKITLHCLSQLQPRPEHATDHTGKRRGMLTAIAWCRSSRSGKSAVWVCRCDCGLFEYRRPGTWASRVSPDDMCDTCLRANVQIVSLELTEKPFSSAFLTLRWTLI